MVNSESYSVEDGGPGSGGGVSISIFFPCYNEADSVEGLLHRAVEVAGKVAKDFEIIIVDDGSSDGTADIAERLADEIEQVRVVHHEHNLGYGAALQSGFRAATKELVFYTDGDGQFDIGELADILPLIADCDIVSCYRLDRKEGLVRRLSGWCWGKLVCAMFGMRIRDVDCAFKLYRRKIFDGMQLRSTGALIDAEVLARATRAGFKITQTGVHHYTRKAGASTGANVSVILRAFRELLKLRKEIMQ